MSAIAISNSDHHRHHKYNKSTTMSELANLGNNNHHQTTTVTITGGIFQTSAARSHHGYPVMNDRVRTTSSHARWYILQFGLRGMSDNENHGFSNMHTTWYFYLELGLLNSIALRCCTIIEYGRVSSSAISVFPYLGLYSTYCHVVLMIVYLPSLRGNEFTREKMKETTHIRLKKQSSLSSYNE